MSVQSEINRISGNVTAALAAIAEKGVTVDSGSNSDDLATLIAAIEAGSGGDATFATGTITPVDTKAASLTIEHGLGSIPSLFIWCAGDNENRIYSASTPNGIGYLFFVSDETKVYARYLNRNTNFGSDTLVRLANAVETRGNGLCYYMGANEQKVTIWNDNSSYGFGETAAPFVWCAVA